MDSIPASGEVRRHQESQRIRNDAYSKVIIALVAAGKLDRSWLERLL